jgi:hypothetical protein
LQGFDVRQPFSLLLFEPLRWSSDVFWQACPSSSCEVLDEDEGWNEDGSGGAMFVESDVWKELMGAWKKNVCDEGSEGICGD